MLRDGSVCFLVFALYSCDVVGQYTLTGPISAPEGSTVTFTCTTSPVQIAVSWSETSDSNTNNYIYFYNSSDARCQYSSGAPPSDYTFDCNSIGVFSLSFPADYSRDFGSVFKCRNFAGRGESNNITLSVTGVYTLTGPTTTAIGSTVTFTCITSPEQSTVTWSETSGSVTNNFLYFYNSAEGRCQRSSGAPPSDYALDCNSTGVFSLSFPVGYSRHRGSVFQCSNPGQGESNNITLTVTGPPDAPTELLAWSDGPTSVILSWKKGSNGGANQHFRVQYKKEADPWTETKDLYEENREPFIQGHIRGLKPETLYFVRVQSTNRFGNSSFTDVERVLLKDVTCSCDIKEKLTCSSNQILLGAGIVLFTLSAVISSTLAIIFFRQKHSKKDGHNTRVTEDQYDNLEGKTGNTYEELQQSHSLKSQDVQSDRFGMWFGIGIASFLPLYVISIILIVVWFKRGHSQMKKGADANLGTTIDMTNNTDSPGDYQNASND